MHSRVVILGNAGSGKSSLAGKIGTRWVLPVRDLDTIFWMPGGYTQKRDKREVRVEVEKRKMEDRWVVEGVYGELAALVIERAECLIWLDMDWATCRESLLERRGRLDEEEQERTQEAFQALMDYAEAYWTRSDGRSHRGHAAIFQQFPGEKYHFRSRREVAEFVHGI